MTRADSPALLGARAERLASSSFIVLAALLAVTALLADSAAFDEVIHLPAGIVQLKTGDLRLAPDHPPFARLWAALPSAFLRVVLPDPTVGAFRTGEFVAVGRDVLEGNSRLPLLTLGRLMVVALLLALLLLVRAAARRLFGADAGLLALAVASLSPSLLAHGHLVTTDLPAALLFLAVLMAFARLGERLSIGRLAAAAALVAALVLTKFSWPIVLPALLVMGAVAAVSRGVHVTSLAGVAAVCGLVAWGSVWACYGFRYSPFRGPGAAEARMHVPIQAGIPAAASHEEAWKTVLEDSKGVPYEGPTSGFARWARRHRVLPEAWIYGVMLLKKMSYPRSGWAWRPRSSTRKSSATSTKRWGVGGTAGDGSPTAMWTGARTSRASAVGRRRTATRRSSSRTSARWIRGGSSLASRISRARIHSESPLASRPASTS